MLLRTAKRSRRRPSIMHNCTYSQLVLVVLPSSAATAAPYISGAYLSAFKLVHAGCWCNTVSSLAQIRYLSLAGPYSTCFNGPQPHSVIMLCMSNRCFWDCSTMLHNPRPIASHTYLVFFTAKYHFCLVVLLVEQVPRPPLHDPLDLSGLLGS